MKDLPRKVLEKLTGLLRTYGGALKLKQTVSTTKLSSCSAVTGVLLQVRLLERRLEEVEWSPTQISQQAETFQAANNTTATNISSIFSDRFLILGYRDSSLRSCLFSVNFGAH
jgi:hypothetical protein